MGTHELRTGRVLRCLAEAGQLWGFVPCEKAEASYVEYALEVDFYNSRDWSTGLRAMALRFYNGQQDLLTDIPWDEATRVYSHSGLTHAAEIQVLNLPSRQWVHLKLSGAAMNEERLELFKRATSVLLVATDPQGRTFRSRVGVMG